MDTVKDIDYRALIRLKVCRERLTRQEYRTLYGLILSGNSKGAMKGLQKILNRTK